VRRRTQTSFHGCTSEDVQTKDCSGTYFLWVKHTDDEVDVFFEDVRAFLEFADGVARHAAQVRAEVGEAGK
jgi:hypothetical protein